MANLGLEAKLRRPAVDTHNYVSASKNNLKAMATPERELEEKLIEKLLSLKYEYRKDIRDRTALEQNFREKFEALNRVRLTDAEFSRLLDEIVTPDVFTTSKTLRTINAFTRDDGTPLNYTLVRRTYFSGASSSPFCSWSLMATRTTTGSNTSISTTQSPLWTKTTLSQSRII